MRPFRRRARSAVSAEAARLSDPAADCTSAAKRVGGLIAIFQITNHLSDWGDQTSRKMGRSTAAHGSPMRTRRIRACLIMCPEPCFERQRFRPSSAHPPRGCLPAASTDIPTSPSATAVLHEPGAPVCCWCACSSCRCSPIAPSIAARAGSLYCTYPAPAAPVAGGGVGWPAPH